VDLRTPLPESQRFAGFACFSTSGVEIFWDGEEAPRHKSTLRSCRAATACAATGMRSTGRRGPGLRTARHIPLRDRIAPRSAAPAHKMCRTPVAAVGATQPRVQQLGEKRRDSHETSLRPAGSSGGPVQVRRRCRRSEAGEGPDVIDMSAKSKQP